MLPPSTGAMSGATVGVGVGASVGNAGADGVGNRRGSLTKIGGGVAVKVGMSDLTNDVAVGGAAPAFSAGWRLADRVNLQAATRSNNAPKISSIRNCFIT